MILAAAAMLALTGCERDDQPKGYTAFQDYVHDNRVGSSPDQWIEIMGLSGQWEKVGLVFQFENDAEECEKAITGLAKANSAREYRCISAN